MDTLSQGFGQKLMGPACLNSVTGKTWRQDWLESLGGWNHLKVSSLTCVIVYTYCWLRPLSGCQPDSYRWSLCMAFSRFPHNRTTEFLQNKWNCNTISPRYKEKESLTPPFIEGIVKVSVTWRDCPEICRKHFFLSLITLRILFPH